MNAFDVLRSRGLIKQHTDADALRRAFDAGPVTFYVGFDPTAPAFHVGNLVPIMCMAWLQRLGHRPIVVHGGGTAMVGDPSGKDKSRELITAAQIAENLAGQRGLFSRFLDLVPEDQTPADAAAWTDTRGILKDNAEWLLPLRYIEFLRDIGRHFSINHMLSAEGTKQRLDRGQGLSFIEFNYHLLQSYDYLVLYRRYGCTLQIGGDDQWFHIIGGADLIRREEALVGRAPEVHGITLPLVTMSDGRKMGKSVEGAIWVDETRLSPYHYYQFWVNVPDADVGRFLRMYTFLDLDRIAALEALEGADIREAKRALAWEATALAHGDAEADRAAAAAAAAFSGGEAEGLPTFAATLPRPIVELLADSGLCKSRSEARRLIQQGGARVGDQVVSSVDAVLEEAAVLWSGKKRAVRILAE